MAFQPLSSTFTNHATGKAPFPQIPRGTVQATAGRVHALQRKLNETQPTSCVRKMWNTFSSAAQEHATRTTEGILDRLAPFRDRDKPTDTPEVPDFEDDLGEENSAFSQPKTFSEALTRAKAHLPEQLEEADLRPWDVRLQAEKETFVQRASDYVSLLLATRFSGLAKPDDWLILKMMDNPGSAWEAYKSQFEEAYTLAHPIPDSFFAKIGHYVQKNWNYFKAWFIASVLSGFFKAYVESAVDGLMNKVTEACAEADDSRTKSDGTELMQNVVQTLHDHFAEYQQALSSFKDQNETGNIDVHMRKQFQEIGGKTEKGVFKAIDRFFAKVLLGQSSEGGKTQKDIFKTFAAFIVKILPNVRVFGSLRDGNFLAKILGYLLLPVEFVCNQIVLRLIYATFLPSILESVFNVSIDASKGNAFSTSLISGLAGQLPVFIRELEKANGLVPSTPSPGKVNHLTILQSNNVVSDQIKRIAQNLAAIIKNYNHASSPDEMRDASRETDPLLLILDNIPGVDRQLRTQIASITADSIETTFTTLFQVLTAEMIRDLIPTVMAKTNSYFEHEDVTRKELATRCQVERDLFNQRMKKVITLITQGIFYGIFATRPHPSQSREARLYAEHRLKMEVFELRQKIQKYQAESSLFYERFQKTLSVLGDRRLASSKRVQLSTIRGLQRELKAFLAKSDLFQTSLKKGEQLATVDKHLHPMMVQTLALTKELKKMETALRVGQFSSERNALRLCRSMSQKTVADFVAFSEEMSKVMRAEKNGTASIALTRVKKILRPFVHIDQIRNHLRNAQNAPGGITGPHWQGVVNYVHKYFTDENIKNYLLQIIDDNRNNPDNFFESLERLKLQMIDGNQRFFDITEQFLLQNTKNLPEARDLAYNAVQEHTDSMRRMQEALRRLPSTVNFSLDNLVRDFQQSPPASPIERMLNGLPDTVADWGASLPIPHRNAGRRLGKNVQRQVRSGIHSIRGVVDRRIEQSIGVVQNVVTNPAHTTCAALHIMRDVEKLMP